MSYNDPKWCCAACKGTRVQIQAWVYVNTHEYVDDVGGIDPENAIWCDFCEDHVKLERIPPQLAFNFGADKKCP